MLHPARLCLLLIATGLAACTQQSLPVFSDPVPLTTPSGRPAYGPRLTQGDPETAILSWMEPAETGASLKFSPLRLGEWDEAKTVVTDPVMFVNWADMPAVSATSGGPLLAFWLSKTGGATYAYQVLTAYSEDSGATWGPSRSPHSDGTDTEHGFVSTYAAANGSGMIWLDGRETPDGPMTLRAASIDPSGTIADEVVVDDSVCDCCQTDTAETDSGTVAVYRNRTIEEIRDIYVSRRVNGAWQPGTTIFDDGWEIEGCPVNGPAIAADGSRIAVAWFTAANNVTTVKAAVSTNSGKSFSPPIEIATQRSLGHVNLAMIDRYSFAVSWMESRAKKDGFLVNMRSVTFDGQTGEVNNVGRTTTSRTVPQMVRIGDELIFAWSDELKGVSKIASVKVQILGFYD